MQACISTGFGWFGWWRFSLNCHPKHHRVDYAPIRRDRDVPACLNSAWRVDHVLDGSLGGWRVGRLDFRSGRVVDHDVSSGLHRRCARGTSDHWGGSGLIRCARWSGTGLEQALNPDAEGNDGRDRAPDAELSPEI